MRSTARSAGSSCRMLRGLSLAHSLSVSSSSNSILPLAALPLPLGHHCVTQTQLTLHSFPSPSLSLSPVHPFFRPSSSSPSSSSPPLRINPKNACVAPNENERYIERNNAATKGRAGRRENFRGYMYKGARPRAVCLSCDFESEPAARQVPSAAASGALGAREQQIRAAGEGVVARARRPMGEKGRTLTDDAHK